MVIDHRPTVQRVLVMTLVLNLLVLLLKALLGWWTGSLSLVADALHSVTDSANNILGIVTTHLSSPLPDRDHPYGHLKFEAMGALGIAMFLGVACYEIGGQALSRLFSPATIPVKVSAIELWLMLVILGVNIFVAFYERGVGLRINSPVLIADASHTMGDIWVTFGVLLGLIGVWLGYPWLDVVLAFPVALLVFRSGWNVLHQNLPWLVDAAAIAPEAIYTIVMAVPGVVNCHQIASRGLVGRQVFVEMHLVVSASDVETAHAITEAVEAALTDHYHPIRISIHIEPLAYASEQMTYEETSPEQKP